MPRLFANWELKGLTSAGCQSCFASERGGDPFGPGLLSTEGFILNAEEMRTMVFVVGALSVKASFKALGSRTDRPRFEFAACTAICWLWDFGQELLWTSLFSTVLKWVQPSPGVRWEGRGEMKS